MLFSGLFGALSAGVCSGLLDELNTVKLGRSAGNLEVRTR